MQSLLALIHLVLQIVSWVVIAYVIVSWLIAFNVVNRYNPFVARLDYALRQLVEPIFRPIRRVVPLVGGIDLAPLILLLLIWFLRRLLYEYF